MSEFKAGRGGLYYKVDERSVVYIYEGNPDTMGMEAEYIGAMHIDYISPFIATLRLAEGIERGKR